MTDDEIERALECCRENEEYCPDCCPLRYDTECTRHLASKALTIINRKNKTIEHQKETIEQLQTALFKCGEEMAEKQATISRRMDEIDMMFTKFETIAAEAVKEFAERLKDRMFNYYECVSESAKGRPYKGDTLMDYEVVDMIEDCIDNLVKEFTGGGDGNQSMQ